MKRLIRKEVARCQPASLRKDSFKHSSSFILSSFSQNVSRLLLTKRLWKCANTISFRKYKRVTCNLPVNFFHVECGIWRCPEYEFCQLNWYFLFFEIQRSQERPSFCSDSVFWYIIFGRSQNLKQVPQNFMKAFNVDDFTLTS